MPRGKKYLEAAAKIEAEKLYEPAAATDLVAETSPSKFDATVEAHIRLGVDAKQSEQNVRGNVALPHGTGKNLRIAVFAQGEKAKEAMDAGADIVGSEDLVKQVTDGQIDFDVALATPDAMGMVGRIGKVLGPRGLMPNPKSGTVTFDIAKAVKEVKAGRVEFRIDKFGIVHAPVGKISFGGSKLRDNFAALMEAIVKAKPADAKGTFIKTVTLAATQGPGIKVDPGAAAKLTT